MQHYQVPSAEYSSYINHVNSLGLAQDYIAQLHASCSSNSPPPLRAGRSERPSIKPVDTCLEWWMISSQCQYLSMKCPV